MTTVTVRRTKIAASAAVVGFTLLAAAPAAATFVNLAEVTASPCALRG